MADVNGNPVYPLMYEGTTYLPIRAVSNMLGVAVDWDGSTQTVLLGKKSPAIITNSGGTISVALRQEDLTEENLRDALTDAGAAEDDIKFCVRMLNTMPKDYPLRFTIKQLSNGKTDYSFDFAPELYVDPFKKATVENFETSDDAEILGENHIGYDYAEIDWSTASSGYIRVKLNKQLGKFTKCTVSTYDDNYNPNSRKFILPLNKWYNIPLLNGNDEYFVTVEIIYDTEYMRTLTRDERDKIVRNNLKVRFNANIENETNWLTLSSGKIDYENAPNTTALAAELTKNCKTDAEKVKTVFNWVAKNIKYDYTLAKKSNEYNAKLDADELNPQYDLFLDGARENLNPDDIITAKSGICEDYATVTVAMLRSLGIKCKLVTGTAYSKGKWGPHAWVAIDPSVIGLNANTLHGWKDADGFIHIDPTNADNPNFTSKASNYKAEKAY